MKNKKGFTLIELMVVVLIVAILAAVAIPIMRGRIDAAKWSEGKAGAGTIATAIRAYAAEKGVTGFDAGDVDVKMGGTNGEELGIADDDLDGTFFVDECYEVSDSSYDATNGLSFTITVSVSTSATTPDAPTTPGAITLTVENNGPAVFAIP